MLLWRNTFKQEDLMKTAPIFALMVFLIAPAYSQTINIHVENRSKPISDLNRIFMQRGPLLHAENSEELLDLDDCKARAYRVSFLLFEFFVDIAIEELAFGSFECKEINVINTYKLFGYRVGTNVGMEGLSEPLFEGWKSWDSFVISEQGKRLLFKIKSDGEIEISIISGE
jgi:hypothetical protein